MNITATNPLSPIIPDDPDYQNRLDAYLLLRNNWNYYRMPFFIATASLGLISSILILCTFLKNKTFSDPCFVCYQGYAISELVYQIYLIIFYAFKLNEKYLQSNGWCWTANVLLDMSLVNLSVHYSSIVIIFLSVHRVVGCLWPQKHHLLDSKTLCRIVTIGTFFIFVPTAIPQAFGSVCVLNNSTQLWGSTYTNDGYKQYSSVLSWFRSSQGIVITVTSALAVGGMVKTALFRYDTAAGLF